MSRPISIRDEAILDAARALFLQRGMKATTAEVAERAQVSEGSVFNRFKTKAELFSAAMHYGLDSSPWITALDARVGKGDLRVQLFEIGMQALEFFRVVFPLSMMQWSSRQCERVFEGQSEPPPARALKRMAVFFRAEIRARRMKKCDPTIAARSFIGAIASYAHLEMMHKLGASAGMPASKYIRGHVDLMWSGLAPDARR